MRAPTRGLAVGLVAGALVVGWSPSSAAHHTDECHDPLVNRIRTELAAFTGWLDEHGEAGFVGEVGWPDDPADAEAWNDAAAAWYADADAAGLWATAWATGEWWGRDYRLAPYEVAEEGGPVATANAQAEVLEAHPGDGEVRRGVNVAGGEFGVPGPLEETSDFSNDAPGPYDVTHHFDSRATFEYLADRGHRLVRIPFRWERVQPELSGPLDAAETDHLAAAVERAADAGLEVVLDVHNYGAYWLSDGSQGVRRPIGSDHVGVADFADLWRRLSARFGDEDAVAGYGLMNEPTHLPDGDGATAAERWERASQAAVNAVRDRGDDTLILVPGYRWSSAAHWPDIHPEPWIDDPAGAVRYEAHHYWDRTGAGQYERSYEEEVAHAAAAGYEPTCPEPGDEPAGDEPPDDDPAGDEPPEPLRLAGGDRFATAAALSRHGWDEAQVAVLARGDDPSDALAGAALAGARDAPLLLTPGDRLHPEAAGELDRLGTRRVLVLGGEQAIEPGVVDELREAGVARTERVAGRTRVGTAAEIADRFGATGDTALLVPGAVPDEARRWPDALAVSGLAARRAGAGAAWPVLVTGERVPEATWAALDRLDVGEVAVVGGASVVPAAVEEELAARGYEVRRLAGTSRYGTSLDTARLDLARGGEGPLVAATGAAFPDGLAAGALTARVGGTLLLVPPSEPTDAQRAWVAAESARLHRLLVAGGPHAVSDPAMGALQAALEE